MLIALATGKLLVVAIILIVMLGFLLFEDWEAKYKKEQIQRSVKARAKK